MITGLLRGAGDVLRGVVHRGTSIKESFYKDIQKRAKSQGVPGILAVFCVGIAAA